MNNSRVSDLYANLLNHLITCDCHLALHDPVAAFFLIDPTSFEFKHIRVDVEANKNALNYAQTVCDFYEKTNKPKNVHVCYKVDVKKFWDTMFQAIESAKNNSSF